MEKFADISSTPQGKFLEGGAFDTEGNLWFVAIGSGWVSYLTPDGKLVPGFNCNPPPEIGQTCEPQGTRWHDGKLYVVTRHRGVLVYDPKTKEVKTLVYTWRNQLFKGPNDLDFDAEGNLYFTDPWATGPGPNASDRTGAVYQYSRDGVLRKIMDDLQFPNGIAVSPDNNTLAIGDCTAGRMLYAAFAAGPTMGVPGGYTDPQRLTFTGVKAGTYFPGNGCPDGIHYDVKGNLWAATARLGGILQIDPRGIILGFVPVPNGDLATTNFAFGGPDNRDIFLDGGDQRHLLALQGAVSRADRPGRRAPAPHSPEPPATREEARELTSRVKKDAGASPSPHGASRRGASAPPLPSPLPPSPPLPERERG